MFFKIVFIFDFQFGNNSQFKNILYSFVVYFVKNCVRVGEGEGEGGGKHKYALCKESVLRQVYTGVVAEGPHGARR